MPPHPHGHHGGGHWGGGGPMFWNPYPVYAAPDPVVEIVPVASDPDDTARKMAYIMSLPKTARPAAYAKLFGRPAPAGVLGETPASSTGLLGTPLPWVAAAVAAYWFFFRKGRR